MSRGHKQTQIWDRPDRTIKKEKIWTHTSLAFKGFLHWKRELSSKRLKLPKDEPKPSLLCTQYKTLLWSSPLRKQQGQALKEHFLIPMKFKFFVHQEDQFLFRVILHCSFYSSASCSTCRSHKASEDTGPGYSKKLIQLKVRSRELRFEIWD